MFSIKNKLRNLKIKSSKICDYVFSKNLDKYYTFEAKYIQNTFFEYGLTTYKFGENGELLKSSVLKNKKFLLLFVFELIFIIRSFILIFFSSKWFGDLLIMKGDKVGLLLHATIATHSLSLLLMRHSILYRKYSVGNTTLD